MSIHGLIATAKEQGGLIEVEPFRPLTVVRHLFVTPEVNKLIEGPWDNVPKSVSDQLTAKDWEERCADLYGDFDLFLNGGQVTVALDPDNRNDECFFKRLYPIENEVWTIRSREPKPGIRVFGSFAETNHFVATNWALRYDLGDFGSDEWEEAIALSRATWTLLFGDQQMPKSGNLNDYIGKQAVSLDAIS